MKTYILGDPHGADRALDQIFDKIKFNYQKDKLICVGDTADGWPGVKSCFDKLLKIKNLVYIMGNHDMYLLEWATKGLKPINWTSQGGINTMKSYGNNPKNVPKKHIELLTYGLGYYVDKKNRAFVHGGFLQPRISSTNPTSPETHELYNLVWDRTLLQRAYEDRNETPERKFFGFEEIFVGHTTTHMNPYCSDVPVHYCNVWDVDTGGGWEGKLTIMNVDTKKYWQSDLVSDLYPELEKERKDEELKKMLKSFY